MRSKDNTNFVTSRGRPAVAVAILALLALSTLAGCLVGPKFEKPKTTAPEKWREEGSPRISTQKAADSLWWKAFQDATLDQLVELAYKQNLSLQVAGLRIVEARAQLGLATGRKYPQVQVARGNATALQVSKNAANNVPNLDSNFWDYQVGFDAFWEMDLWGKYRRGAEAEAASMYASMADYDYALVSLTAEVARTYAVIRTFEVLIAQAQENVKVQEEGQRIAEARYRAGATSELDVTQATTLLESTRATIPQLQISLQQSQNALCTLLGQPTGTVETLLGGPKEIPAAPAEVAVSVPAEMLRRRPDIRSAELTAAAQCARIGVAKADLYPSFTLFGSIGWQASNAGGVSRGLFSGDSLFFALSPLRFLWPIFNYGRIENNIRIQDARFQQLLVNYRNAVLKAAQEAEDALTGFLNAQEALVFSQGSVKAALRSVELSLVQYREGAVDYQRVLDAQRSLLQEQNTLARTRSDIVTNLIALYKALGGGWELRQDQPVVQEAMQTEMKNRTNWGDYLSPPPAKKESNPPSQKQ